MLETPSLSSSYSTHLPILEALCKRLTVHRVLEFGAGLHSTPFFLTQPDLEQLVSIESDEEWREKVEPDDRLWLRREVPALLAPKTFDLIFIDDGISTEERVKTIHWVLSRPHPPVVIHDAEVPEYDKAIRQYERPFVFRFEKPWTAVIGMEGSDLASVANTIAVAA